MITKSIYTVGFIYLIFSAQLYSQSHAHSKKEINKLVDKAIDNWYKDNFDESLKLAKKALDQSIAINDYNLIAESYNVIGVNFDDLVMMDKALFYYNKGLKYAEKTNNAKLKSKLNNNVANIYFFDKKKYNTGLTYYHKALNYSRATNDSVKIYLRKLNMTWAYFEIKDFKKGKAYLDYINHYSRFGDESTSVLQNMLNGIYFERMQDSKKANFYYLEAIKMGKNGNEKFDLSITHKKYSDFLAKEKDYKNAYNNLVLYNTLTNEIVESEKAQKAKVTGLNLELNEYLREIGKIEAEYKTRQKVLLQEQTMSRRKYIAVISIFIISIILIYFYIQNSRLIQKNRLNGLRNKIQQNIINASLSGQEIERKKIASFLHDNISALLSSAGLHLSVFNAKNENPSEEITKTIALLGEAHDKVRDLSHELIPALLVRFGLLYALADLCEKNSNSTIHFVYQSDIDNQKRYPEDLEIKIYFIVTELLNNVMKHSHATTGKVFLKENSNFLKIQVSDNGKGFDTNQFQIIEGFGINQIKARVNAMKGNLNINSKIDSGTIITIEVPI
jgi:signal transduction histidine kinase